MLRWQSILTTESTEIYKEFFSVCSVAKRRNVNYQIINAKEEARLAERFTAPATSQPGWRGSLQDPGEPYSAAMIQ